MRKHDPGYFRNVVKPFIQCKMEKTFVDYYLLGDKVNINKYEQLDKLRPCLNAMEKCLLIQSLVE